jgi:signal transduction histidine kinase
MEEGIHRLNDIIDALASAEQVELGTFTYAPIRQAFEPIAQELVNSFAELLEHRKQTVQTHIDTMPEISCDSVLLKRVLGELIENASDYSPSGTVIDLTARLRAGKLEVTVSDKGCGIPSQDLERVGQKYVRGSNASIYKVDGNGLGLYTARGIIEMAHGELRVKSEEGKGTDVTFVLPA